ncbi:hypothetical protein OSZ53_07605 [Edwardsiella ictaluri]
MTRSTTTFSLCTVSPCTSSQSVSEPRCLKALLYADQWVMLTTLAAGTYGIPTITSNINGLPETVRHQQIGFCLTPTLSVEQYANISAASIDFSPQVYDPVQDRLTPPLILSPEQLADSIESLYRNPETYRRLSDGAREYAAVSRCFNDLAQTLCQRLLTRADPRPHG